MIFILNRITNAEDQIELNKKYIYKLNNIDNDEELQQDIRNEIYRSFGELKKRRLGRLNPRDVLHNNKIEDEAKEVLQEFDKRFNTTRGYGHTY